MTSLPYTQECERLLIGASSCFLFVLRYSLISKVGSVSISIIAVKMMVQTYTISNVSHGALQRCKSPEYEKSV